MKKTVSIILGIAGLIIAWFGVSRGETDMTFPLVNMMAQIFAGFMVMGAGFALARWE